MKLCHSKTISLFYYHTRCIRNINSNFNYGRCNKHLNFSIMKFF